MTAGLADFYKYNLWANLRLLDACAQLSDTQLDATMVGTYGSVRQTLMHLFSSEEGYARHFNFSGRAPIPPLKESDAFPGFDELRRRAVLAGNELIALAEQGNPDEILHLDGGTYDASVMIVMMQAVDHGIDHRSQIATLLSQQGIEPPELDAWAYNDATRQSASDA
ncbi:MAG TPA: DinB family protein [Ktedonobacterales bacterium]